MWASLATILLGVVGWGITNLLFSPLKEIIDLRREAQECLIIYGNLAKDASQDERFKASEAFRRIGAALIARHIAAYWWVKGFYQSCLRWDIHSAGAQLVSLGNTTQFDGFSFVNLSPILPLIRQCLQLPTPEEPSLSRVLREHAAQPPAEE